MPGLVGRDPAEVFAVFRNHLAGLLNKTVTDARLALIHVRNTNKAQVSFRQNSVAIAAPVSAELFLYVGQDLRVDRVADKQWKLRTVAYRYRIQGSAGLEDDDCLRWEYVAREIRDSGHCRHHLHLQGEYELGPRKTIPLAKIHLPTGWVTVEEIIRFLITELDVKPRDEKWEAIVLESEEKFKQWTGREVG